LKENSRPAVTAALRDAVGAVRRQLLSGQGTVPSDEEIVAIAGTAIAANTPAGLQHVINCTGIVLHTNLGRAPLAPEALAAISKAASGYTNLEFDLESGRRGARTGNVETLLCELTGAQAALVVNNNAAAVLLALSALATDGEVIISRGELVEIGGGFRIPDVIRQGGARLVEVGTTNRTRLSDYVEAITPATRALLKVHSSNYRMLGFTAEVGLAELADLARAHGLLLLHDLGSGTLLDLQKLGRPHEPTVQECLRAGADLVAFSGDKLLGGPQAGLLVGSEVAIGPLRRHPLLRAVRLDKLSLAALEATLRLYIDPDLASARVPVLRMLAQDEATLKARAQRLRDALVGAGYADIRVDMTTGYAGGGSLPEASIPSRAISVGTDRIAAEDFAYALRHNSPPVVGRIAADRLLLDVLTLAEEECAEIVAAFRRILA
jgi:L-seryl-tRNA(Ser) seleniumtransferase